MTSLISLQDCFTKGLLKKSEKSINLAVKSLRQAEFFLKESRDLSENKKHMSLIALYNSYFHAVRSLLYKDGFKERSHFCMARYFEFEYVKKDKINQKFLHSFETTMSLRHSIQYSTEKIEISENIKELIGVLYRLIK